MDKKETNFEVLYSEEIFKKSKSGRQIGSTKVEVKKEVNSGVKFIQITQRKEAFMNEGHPNYKPASTSWITLDPENKEVKDALSTAYKK